MTSFEKQFPTLSQRAETELDRLYREKEEENKGYSQKDIRECCLDKQRVKEALIGLKENLLLTDYANGSLYGEDWFIKRMKQSLGKSFDYEFLKELGLEDETNEKEK